MRTKGPKSSDFWHNMTYIKSR